MNMYPDVPVEGGHTANTYIDHECESPHSDSGSDCPSVPSGRSQAYRATPAESMRDVGDELVPTRHPSHCHIQPLKVLPKTRGPAKRKYNKSNPTGSTTASPKRGAAAGKATPRKRKMPTRTTPEDTHRAVKPKMHKQSQCDFSYSQLCIDAIAAQPGRSLQVGTACPCAHVCVRVCEVCGVRSG